MARALGCEELYLKDEGRNPSGSFKDRGATVAVTRLRELGVKTVVLNSSGNAGAAWALYAHSVGGGTSPAALAGLALLIGLQVFMSLPSLAGNPSVNLDEQPTRILAYLVPSAAAIALFTAVHVALARRRSAST